MTRRAFAIGRPAAAVLAAVVAAAALVSALMMLWWPLGFDQGSFSANGAAILAGGLPYRDAWEMRGPLALYLFAAIQATFGQTAFAVRLVDVLALAGVDVLVWRLVRRVGGRTAALAAVALWTLYVVSWGFTDTAQPDGWATYALLGVAALASRGRPVPGARTLLAAGAAVGLCALMKPTYPAYLLVPWAAVAARVGRRPAALARAAGLLAAGCAVPVALAAAAMVAAGIWPAYVESQFGFVAAVYRPYGYLTVAERLGVLAQFAAAGVNAPVFAVALPAAVGGARALWRRGEGPLAAALVALGGVGLFCLLLQGKFYLYHWTPVFAAVGVLAAFGLAELLGGLDAAGAAGRPSAGRPSPVTRAAGWVAVAVLAVVVALRPLAFARPWAAYLVGRADADAYYGSFGEGWTTNPGDERRVAAFLRAHTPPGTPVAVWSVDAAVPFLAGRPQVGRFPVTEVLKLAPGVPLVRKYRREYAAALRAARPAYFVRGFHVERARGRRAAPLDSLLPEAGDFLARTYVFDRRVGDIDLYRRRGYPEVPPSGAPARE